MPQTTGTELANALRTHIEHYPIEIFEERKIEKVELQGMEKGVSTVGGEVFYVEEGETLIMPKDIPHAVYGQERFKMLLTVSF